MGVARFLSSWTWISFVEFVFELSAATSYSAFGRNRGLRASSAVLFIYFHEMRRRLLILMRGR